MNTELERFVYADQPIRATELDGEPWFSLVDVCSVLGIKNPTQLARRLDADEISTGKLSTAGGEQTVTLVNEFGLYEIMLTSRSPAAKPFKRWVKREVLPAIRNQGMYLTDDAKADIAMSAHTLACQLDDIDRYAGTHPGAVRAKTDAIRTAQLSTLRSMCGKDAFSAEQARHLADPA